MTIDGSERHDLGLGLEPGAKHYRAYVGPPEDYDLVSAMCFGLLTALGLRQGHSLLDIGCGSLRVGRLLIPYLNSGGYTGFDPNEWLIEAGIERECGRDQVALKRPRFVISEDPAALDPLARFDYALAQSIFSHAGLELISEWLDVLSTRLVSTGALVATFLESTEDHAGARWVYPECVAYRPSTIDRIANEKGFRFTLLDWRHPRQRWGLFSRPDFPLDSLETDLISWNHAHDAGLWR